MIEGLVCSTLLQLFLLKSIFLMCKCSKFIFCNKSENQNETKLLGVKKLVYKR